MPLRCVLPQSGTRCRTYELKYWNQQLPFRTATPRAAPGFTPLRAARQAFPRGAATLCFIKLFLAATPRLGSTDRRTGMRQAPGLRGRTTKEAQRVHAHARAPSEPGRRGQTN